MAGQAPDRRDVLKLLAYASAAAGFPGFARWTYGAQDHAHAQTRPQQIKPQRYTPQFLSAHQYATLERLADLIIPADETPGALAAGAPEFIDFMLARDPEIQYPFRTGLVWLDARSRTLFDKEFLATNEGQQTDLLRSLAYAQRFQPGQDDGRAFFRLLRRYVVIGYYTSRIGMEQLECPSLRAYSESPGCPHANDPEHRHLPSPPPR